MIMLSNATYTAYDGPTPRAGATTIGTDLLRDTLGFTGVTITDSLNGTAAARGVSATSLAYRAARAGTDMLMLTGTEPSTKAQFDYLVAKADGGPDPARQAQGLVRPDHGAPGDPRRLRIRASGRRCRRARLRRARRRQGGGSDRLADDRTRHAHTEPRSPG